MLPTVQIDAPAKVNLALAVGPPRDGDGFHPIASWMVTVDLCDELVVTRLPADRFSRYAILWHEEARRRSDIDWSVTSDLAVRAHRALEEHAGRVLPVQMKLEKRIPVGGGLGGGSSDAAAMLLAVDRLFRLDLGPDRLAEIAAGLGSDIPFLLEGGSALVEGVGDRIEPHAATPELHLVLVLPEASCPTGPVYRAFDEQTPGPLRDDAVRRIAGDGSVPPEPDAPFNDLAPAAMRLAPDLGSLADEVHAIAERPVHLTGSGSTLFVIVDDPLHGEHLARAIEERTGTPALAVTGRGGPTEHARRPETAES